MRLISLDAGMIEKSAVKGAGGNAGGNQENGEQCHYLAARNPARFATKQMRPPPHGDSIAIHATEKSIRQFVARMNWLIERPMSNTQLMASARPGPARMRPWTVFITPASERHHRPPTRPRIWGPPGKRQEQSCCWRHSTGACALIQQTLSRSRSRFANQFALPAECPALPPR